MEVLDHPKVKQLIERALGIAALVRKLVDSLEPQQVNRIRLGVEIFLLCSILYLLFLRPSKPGKAPQREELSEKEIDDLIREWNPEPLVPRETKSYTGWAEGPVIKSHMGPVVEVEGREGRAIVNLASSNFLGLAGDKDVERACVDALNKYGCGSCGPRGFYGTIDVHLELERRLAQFYGTEEAIIYSYDVATAASVIPAFLKRNDVIVVDEAANFAIQSGCQLSRSRVYYFRHNDPSDLERVLQQVDREDRKARRPLTRRFIVVEGISHHRGDVTPLDQIFALKEKYRYRLMVDETYSFGVLGARGRGAIEHFGLRAQEDVDIVVASMSTALGTVGGFCVGSRVIVDHQRLSGSGYCFSASLPPFLASAGVAVMDKLEGGGRGQNVLGGRAAENARVMRGLLNAGDIKGLRMIHREPLDAFSPLIVLEATGASGPNDAAAYKALDRLAAEMLNRGYLLCVAKVSPLDRYHGLPSVRVCVTAEHTGEHIRGFCAALRDAARAVM